MSRKTITIPEPVYDDLEAASTDDESFGETISRLIDTGTDGESPDETGEHAANTPEPLTVDHIDDIAAAASSRTTRELETLLRGR